VVVLDKARFPRDKTCGDGLTAQALRLYAQLGLDSAALCAEAEALDVDTAVLVGPNGRTVTLPLAAQLAVVAPRRALDAAFVMRLRSTDAELREGVAVRSVRDSPDAANVMIELDDGRGVEGALGSRGRRPLVECSPTRAPRRTDRSR